MTRVRRITLVDAYPHLRGGSQAQLRWLAAELRDAGWDVGALVPALGPLTRDLARDAVPTVVVPATGPLGRYGGGGVRTAALVRLPRYWWRARGALRGTHVAHLNDHRAVLLYGPPARLAGAKVVWHAHALAATRPVDRACAVIAHVVVAPSEAVAERLRGLGVPVRIIPGHVDDPAVGWAPRDPPRIVTVGRLHPTKGQDVLLEAVARLRATHPDLEVDLVGASDPHDTAYERALRERCRMDDLGGVVHFHGHVDDPWPLVSRARVYAQPSRAETQGLAFVQALRVGVPTVASDLPALREQGAATNPTRFVPVEDVEALEAALAAALQGRPAPSRGTSGAPRGAPEGTIASWLSLYEQLVAA